MTLLAKDARAPHHQPLVHITHQRRQIRLAANAVLVHEQKLQRARFVAIQYDGRSRITLHFLCADTYQGARAHALQLDGGAGAHKDVATRVTYIARTTLAEAKLPAGRYRVTRAVNKTNYWAVHFDVQADRIQNVRVVARKAVARKASKAAKAVGKKKS